MENVTTTQNTKPAEKPAEKAVDSNIITKLSKFTVDFGKFQNKIGSMSNKEILATLGSSTEPVFMDVQKMHSCCMFVEWCIWFAKGMKVCLNFPMFSISNGAVLIKSCPLNALQMQRFEEEYNALKDKTGVTVKFAPASPTAPMEIQMTYERDYEQKKIWDLILAMDPVSTPELYHAEYEKRHTRTDETEIEGLEKVPPKTSAMSDEEKKKNLDSLVDAAAQMDGEDKGKAAIKKMEFEHEDIDDDEVEEQPPKIPTIPDSIKKNVDASIKKRKAEEMTKETSPKKTELPKKTEEFKKPKDIEPDKKKQKTEKTEEPDNSVLSISSLLKMTKTKETKELKEPTLEQRIETELKKLPKPNVADMDKIVQKKKYNNATVNTIMGAAFKVVAGKDIQSDADLKQIFVRMLGSYTKWFNIQAEFTRTALQSFSKCIDRCQSIETAKLSLQYEGPDSIGCLCDKAAALAVFRFDDGKIFYVAERFRIHINMMLFAMKPLVYFKTFRSPDKFEQEVAVSCAEFLKTEMEIAKYQHPK